MVAVKGLKHFCEYFENFQDSYILIGGVACELAMDEAGIDFRATKDLDIVLCAEAIDSLFVSRFWQFIKDGGYKSQEKSTDDKQFYRFKNPSNKEFPIMLELFSRKPDQMILIGESYLTPIPVDDDISSLSAILLDNDYYQCIENGRYVVDGIPILKPEYILAFKARAWLDLTERKNAGETVDSKNIKKHRNDVFKLYRLLSSEQRVKISAGIKADIKKFVAAMPDEEGLNIQQFGLRNQSLDDVIENLILIYQL